MEYIKKWIYKQVVIIIKRGITAFKLIHTLTRENIYITAAAVASLGGSCLINDRIKDGRGKGKPKKGLYLRLGGFGGMGGDRVEAFGALLGLFFGA